MRELRATPGSGALALRIAVGTHVVGVCVCALFSLLDSSTTSLRMPPEYSFAGLVLGVLFLAALVELYACPIFVLAVALRRGFSRQAVYSIFAEILLCIAQMFVLLPGYQ